MFRSKADRILSRYRPIAPKPLPLPLSGSLATDLSSSCCASLDSFTSSGKARRSRKRRIAPPPPGGKFLKNPKSDRSQIVSGPSNSNAGASASSLTQGNSDATVPRTDFGHLSQACGSHMSTSRHLAMDVSELPRMPSGDPAILATPFNHNLTGNLVEQARMFMVADARKARQQPSVPLPSFPRSSHGYGGGDSLEKDLGFMERAAASTVLPDRAAAAGLSCSAVCMKGVGYSGGGFTELIRGITRLPTAADVQSLMQARTGTPAMESGMIPSSIQSISCEQTVPDHAEVLPPCPESHSSAQASIPCWAAVMPSRVDEADDGTLPLLPNLPSKDRTLPLLPTSPSEAFWATSKTQADSPLYDSSYKSELPADIRAAEFHTGFTVDRYSANALASCTAGSRGARVQMGSPRQANSDANDAEGHPPLCSPQVPKLLSGLASSCSASALRHDGSTVDQVYLQQVYGGSTDPVLLVDDNRQVLWCNRSYERALKSLSERLTGMPASTGPYIDPLGHPTPLGSFVLNQACSTSRFVNCTLWGFLRKLVMPEVDGSPSMVREMKADGSRQELQVEDQGSSRFSVGERASASLMQVCSNSMPAAKREAARAMAGCGGVGKLTSVTLESVTEVYNQEGLASVGESVETVESRLGMAGSEPAFITDCTSRVRWANTAFKQMLGYSEQQGSNGMMAPNKAGLAKHEPPAELTFVCSAEKIPRAAQAFSGLVNLEWIKSGKRRSMTVPCDVSRLAPTATWVWRFDLPLSLSLNLCV